MAHAAGFPALHRTGHPGCMALDAVERLFGEPAFDLNLLWDIGILLGTERHRRCQEHHGKDHDPDLTCGHFHTNLLLTRFPLYILSLFFEVAIHHIRQILVPNVRMAVGASSGRVAAQVGAVGQESAARHSRSGIQLMVTAAAGRVVGELEAVSLRIGHPVEPIKICGQVLNHISGTGNGLGGHVFKKVAVGQMTIHALGGKSLGIPSAVNRLFPCVTKWIHGMAGNAEGIGVGCLDHKTGSQYHDACQDKPRAEAEPPALFTSMFPGIIRSGHRIISFEAGSCFY